MSDEYVVAGGAHWRKKARLRVLLENESADWLLIVRDSVRASQTVVPPTRRQIFLLGKEQFE